MKRQTLWIFLLASTGILSMGSSAVAFSAIRSVGPITKCSWRLQTTSICFLILVLVTYKSRKAAYVSLVFTYWKRIFISGISVGLNFALWNISMEYTSVAHSMLFLYSCPILLVIYYFARRERLRFLQIIGAFLGFVGMSLMCFLSSSSEGTTWYGDIIALAGAVSLCINLILSEQCIKESPLMYLFSIHFMAMIFCSVLSISIEPSRTLDLVKNWYTFDGVYGAYLGIVCGVIGNGVFYYLLKLTSPFVVSVMINFDPVVGSVFAFAFGYQKDPSIFTYAGGAIVLAGNFIATAGYYIAPIEPKQTENGSTGIQPDISPV